ncbi:IS3 family transposase [Streptomyces sp. KL2]|uniref:IS3 family transposase n=1 Tax=Streptomyces sp. KL2 TaxID=3050126 RepID=UPI00397A7EA2
MFDCSSSAASTSSFSSFHHRRATAAGRAARQADDAVLAARIRAVHRESDGTYSVPRITAEFREAGERVNHKRIARVMRASIWPACGCGADTAPPSRTRPG